MQDNKNSDLPERRKDTQIDIALLKQELGNLKSSFFELKECKLRYIEKNDELQANIMEELRCIKLTLEGQQKFFSGVVWMATGVLAAAGFALNYFKH